MNIDTYNEKCRLLASLATEAINLEGLNDKTKNELEEIRKNILANHYRITLLGSFSAGKSTIFDTACGGGRELSPTGFGIKTSAVPAEAHSIELGVDEYAFITWKTDKEILKGFIESISPEIRDLDLDRFASASDEEIIDKINMNNDHDLNLLRSALVNAQQHSEELKSYGTDHTRNELFRIGGLVLKYYKEFKISISNALDFKTKVSIGEATCIVRFPVNWHLKEDNDSLTWNDIRFLFVRSVAFYVSSPDLAKLKAVLVDCPGLHASRWDNQIVHECIAHSDAIIWLQGDQGRQLSLTDIEEARRFSDYGITSEAIFLAFNAKGVSKIAAEQILDANLRAMEQFAGLKVDKDRVAIFNALLALRCKQAQAKLSGCLTSETTNALSHKVKKQVNLDKLPDGGDDPDKNASYLIKKDIIRQASIFLDEDIDDPWTDNTISNLLSLSHWEDVIRQATQFIVDTKGKSRLITRGAKPIFEAIASFEENLEHSEKRAAQNFQDHALAKNAAEKVLNEFGDKVNGLLLPYQKDINLTLDAELGIGPGIKGELLERFSRKDAMISLQQNLENAIDTVNNERDVREAVRCAAVEWMKAVITGWQVDARANRSAAIYDFQRTKMHQLETKMHDYLQNAVQQGRGLLGAVSFRIPQPEDHVLSGYQAGAQRQLRNSFDTVLDKADKFAPMRYMRDRYEDIRKLITGSTFDRKNWKKRAGEYVNELYPVIYGKVVEDVTKDFLLNYFEAIASQIEIAKEKMRKDFQDRLLIMEQNLNKTQEERNEIAEQAKLIREKVIVPFRARVEEFIKETEATLPEAVHA